MGTKIKLVLATKQKIDGLQRKLGWFSCSATDLYFEVGGLFLGSHTSYHKDGNLFRTSPVTGNRASHESRYLPLAEFQGWYQLGISMIRKSVISSQPHVAPKDKKGNIQIHEIDLDAFPIETLNFVVELLDPASETFLNIPELQPPPEAQLAVLRFFQPWMILTTLGHDHNLLVRPAQAGFVASHFNSRYSASRPGQKYRYEAYQNE